MYKVLYNCSTFKFRSIQRIPVPIEKLYEIMIRPIVFLLFFNILLGACIAKIENSVTNTSNHIEKSVNNTPTSDAKPAASSSNPTYAPAPSFLRNDFWRSGVGQVLSIGGIATAIFAVVGGLAWMFSTTFGLRTCNLFGNCEKNGIPYNNGGNLQDAVLQNNAIQDTQYIYPYNNLPSYYKRSVDVVAPIIKNLASAVEKMEKVTDRRS